MCGRYTITTPTAELASYFGVLPPTEAYLASADARPSQNLPLVLDNEPTQMVVGHWGYRIKIKGKEKELINVRAENILQKPYWRRIAKQHRCIILADGFYEWTKDSAHQKFRFTLQAGPMAFAGIYAWEQKKMSDEIRPFFSIITVAANKEMKPIHDRMPAILDQKTAKQWIGEGEPLELLQPFARRMTIDAL